LEGPPALNGSPWSAHPGEGRGPDRGLRPEREFHLGPGLRRGERM